MAITKDHLAEFLKMNDAKEICKAIKSQFGINDESKKMQKYLLKQQFKSFSISNSKGLHKGYDRFQSLLGQLVAHGAGFSTKHANQKFLREGSSSYIDELMYSFFANQSSGPKLDHEDLEQLDEFDLEEMDLKWQVTMISMRLKKFYKKTKRKLHFDAKEPVGFDNNKVECFNFHNIGHFARECRSKGNQDSRRRDAGNTRYKARDNGKRPAKQDEHKAMVTIDGEGLDTEMSAKDKSGLGYGSQIHDGILSYENEVFASIFDSRSSDVEDSHDNPHQTLKGKSVVDSGCSRYMTRNKAYLVDYQDFNGGLVAFGGRVYLPTLFRMTTPVLLVTKGKQHKASCKAKVPITAENKAKKTAVPKDTNNSASTQDSFDAGNSEMETDNAQEYYVLPLCSSYTSTVKSSKAKNRDEKHNEDTDSKTNEESVDQED
uniref:Ribonuclease H-like domain-containing protein n=1 Tax=Tanacetum cinerariifolium TaxID=118510 RepID=A0A6L2LJT1_TANCI|nr:ribonuclease H-like domain-containing protein [Tanacetum cinerariifolium]